MQLTFTEKDNEIIVCVGLPHLENISIEVSASDTKPTCVINYGDFKRTISLPVNVDPQSQQSTVENDVVKITFGKHFIANIVASVTTRRVMYAPGL